MEVGILPPELKAVEQLFAGNIQYVVPKYQRSFAWGQDEIEELWEDILAAVARGGDYFLGTIVLHRKSDGPQEIIDGQQRLCCLNMVFSAIRNVFMAARDERAQQLFLAFLGGKDYARDAPVHPKLVLNQTNDETYSRHVVCSNNLDVIQAALRGRGLHESNRYLLKAYHFFLSKVTTEVAGRGTRADDFLVPLIDCLRTRVKLITIPVASEEDANLFFESLNARGKELAVSDLVKNRLYLEAGDQVARAQHLWEKMENELGRRPIPEYLRHFWIAKKIDAKGSIVREKQLYRMVAQDIRGKKGATLSLTLLGDLATSAADYAKITDYDLWPDDSAYDQAFASTLDDLRLFRVTQCNPILLNAIHCFKKPKDVARAFRIVANFSFRYFVIGNQSPGNLERESNGIAARIRSERISGASDLAESFRAINPDATFRSDFSLAVMPPKKAKLARYTLAKLTNHLSDQASRGGSELVANPDAKQVTLEHILPQNPGPAWTASFPPDLDPHDYIDRIGNLTLLTAKLNRQVAATSFQSKGKQAYDDSRLAINDYVKAAKKWTHLEIEERQERLAKAAVEVWKI